MIFGFIGKDSGPGFHRIRVPLEDMADRLGIKVHISNTWSEETFDRLKPTHIFYNRNVRDEILALASKYHCEIVVDVDDWWFLDPHHILYEENIKNQTWATSIRHLELADKVTCTHERLAAEVYKWNRNVTVLPNAIPKNSPYFPTDRPIPFDHRRRIFWQGSVTHERDIALLKGPMKRLDNSRFVRVMAGVKSDEPVWHNMITSYSGGAKMKDMILLPGTFPTSYYRNYQFADICVCPLVASPFNSMKSNLKVLEAAHMGLPCIASHVDPYLNINGLMYVKKQLDWNKWISSSEELLYSFAEELSDWADRFHNFQTINDQRAKLFL